MRKTTISLFNIKMFRGQTIDEVKIVFFKVILIAYYKHYKNLVVDAPKNHDVALKVSIICLHGDTTY